jgi:microcystin degradation protein MlrC
LRVAVGQFMEESPSSTRPDLEHFRNNQLLYDDEIMAKLRGARVEVGGFLDALEPAAAEVVPTVAANCVSSGPVPRATFDRLTGEPLPLHGSMVLDDHPDAEGELLAAVRKQVGPAVPVVATLDLHAHVNLKTA